MTRPAVSACIVTCNQERYIRQCVESVLHQNGEVSVEILVGDDCSDDSTSSIVAELARQHPGVVVHNRNNPRLGVWENLRWLLLRASGEFVTISDGDDYWLPDKLKTQLAYMQAHPECVAVYTNAMTVTESGHPIGLFNDEGDRSVDLPGLLRRGNFLHASSVLMRAHLRQGLIDIEGKYLDYRAHLLHARKGQVAQIGQPLTVYRVNASGSVLANANDFVRSLYWEAIMDVPRDMVTDGDFARGLADFYKRVVFRSLSARRPALAREWAPRILAASPYGRLRTGLLVLCSVTRSLYVELIGRLKASRGGAAKVLYRR